MRKKALHIKLFSLFFLALYSASVLKVYLPFVNYYLNYTYISTTLCENRDKPQMHCNGKCHLQKTIEKTQETKDKDTSVSSKLPAFQEVPGKALNIEFDTDMNINNQIVHIVQWYSLPASDILTPPPQANYTC